MRGITLDPDSHVVREHYAVVYVPRRSRSRFPVSSVQTCLSREEALANASPDDKKYAAKVAGPSRSSEGQHLYYLVEWL